MKTSNSVDWSAMLGGDTTDARVLRLAAHLLELEQVAHDLAEEFVGEVAPEPRQAVALRYASDELGALARLVTGALYHDEAADIRAELERVFAANPYAEVKP